MARWQCAIEGDGASFDRQNLERCTDGNGSAEMALVDRNNDGRVESTEKQFETLYPNLDWDI